MYDNDNFIRSQGGLQKTIQYSIIKTDKAVAIIKPAKAFQWNRIHLVK